MYSQINLSTTPNNWCRISPNYIAAFPRLTLNSPPLVGGSNIVDLGDQIPNGARIIKISFLFEILAAGILNSLNGLALHTYWSYTGILNFMESKTSTVVEMVQQTPGTVLKRVSFSLLAPVLERNTILIDITSLGGGYINLNNKIFGYYD